MERTARDSAEEALRRQRAEWEVRLRAIRDDRRRESAPLEADFEEQAVQRENDEALDALDARGRSELAAIASALERIEAGTWGTCARCGDAIDPDRLRARPAAELCMPCAEQGEGG